jgi:arylsulfatase A-like enzyme
MLIELQIISKLKELKLDSNTLVFFTSDNGKQSTSSFKSLTEKKRSMAGTRA